MFQALGDRVRYWTTFNEPTSFCDVGYGGGVGGLGPTPCSVNASTPGCVPQDNLVNNTLVCSYNLLNAHALTVPVFRRLVPNGHLGIVLLTHWAEPFDPASPADQAAAERYVEYNTARFADPLYFGDWPASVKAGAGNLLPAFTPAQLALLKNATPDFYALNHYTTYYARANNSAANGPSGAFTTPVGMNGSLIGPRAEPVWLFVYPPGLGKAMTWVAQRYHNPDMVITESGVAVPNEGNMTLPGVLNDTFRINYYKDYLASAAQAVNDFGVNLRGYFAWSLLDNFEWVQGYSQRFGITYVDFATQQRFPKASATG